MVKSVYVPWGTAPGALGAAQMRGVGAAEAAALHDPMPASRLSGVRPRWEGPTGVPPGVMSSCRAS